MSDMLRRIGHAILPGFIDPPKPRTFDEARARCEDHLRAIGVDATLPQSEEEWEAFAARDRAHMMTVAEFAEALGKALGGYAVKLGDGEG